MIAAVFVSSKRKKTKEKKWSATQLMSSTLNRNGRCWREYFLLTPVPQDPILTKRMPQLFYFLYLLSEPFSKRIQIKYFSKLDIHWYSAKHTEKTME